MNYKIKEKENKKYVEIYEEINTETQVLDIIGICMSFDIQLVMLKEISFSEKFIDLKQGVAGIALQKFVNYNIKTVGIIEDENKIKGRFKELISEINKGNHMRIFSSEIDAENWLLN